MTTTMRGSAQLACLFIASTLGVALHAVAQTGAQAALPAPVPAAAFGVTEAHGQLTISSGSGLVLKVRRAGGDITSIRYKGGPELQAQTKYSHISSGIGATTTYSVADGVIKLTLTTSTVQHYLLVRQHQNTIYMATHISAEPSVGELRWITRLDNSRVSEAPLASNLWGTVGTIESGDVFGTATYQTRSKYYGNARAMDLGLRGVGGAGVGIFMAYGNRESSSGGPFFRDIQNQTGAHTELYNYMNSGHAQTEENRLGLHGPYALVFTDGAAPAESPPMAWVGSHGLAGWVGPSGRGKVIGNGLAGRDPAYAYTVGFANASAQYWTRVQPNGAFASYNMKAGSYAMTVYKNELEVHTESVTVYPGGATTINTRTIWEDPATATPLWRIGAWDGTPLEFMNGKTFTERHPSDERNYAWGPVSVAVGSPAGIFPAAQWKSINSPTTITFTLNASESRTVRYASASPRRSQGDARPSRSTTGRRPCRRRRARALRAA